MNETEVKRINTITTATVVNEVDICGRAKYLPKHKEKTSLKEFYKISARRSVMMILKLNLSDSLAKPLVIVACKTEHGIFVKFKKPSKTAVVLIAGVTIF